MSADALAAAAVAGLALIWFVWLARLLLLRGDGLATPAYDQGFFQQIVWNLGNGNGFRSSLSAANTLGLHFSPILLVPAALERLWPDPRLLSLVHAAALAVSGPAAFLFLRAAWQPRRAATLLALATAAGLPIWALMQRVALADFHPEALALPMVLMAGWAGLTGRPFVLWAAALAALTAKEDQVYPVVVIGLMLVVLGPPLMRRHALAVSAFAVVWGLLVVGALMPALRAGAVVDTDNYYAWLGRGSVVLRAPLEQPDAVLAAVLRPDAWFVVAGAILSLGALPLLRPDWLLLTVPPLLANLLSRHEPQPVLGYHYGLLLVVPLLVAAAAGGRRVLESVALQRGHRGTRSAVAAAIPVIALAVGLIQGVLPPAVGADPQPFQRAGALDRARASAKGVPGGAILAVDDGLAAALATRGQLQIVPWVSDAAYVLVDRQAVVPGYVARDQRTTFLERAARNRRLLGDDGRFTLWSPVGG